MGAFLVLTVTFHIVAWICSLQPVVTARDTQHITHYTHETRGGPNSTILLTAGTPQPNLAVGAAWGSILVFDNEMRAGPSRSSPLLGRITGKVAGIVSPSTTSDNETRVQLVMHHVYGNTSIYQNSIINVVGIFFFPPPWEMSVVGCTGVLRGYTGYGISQPISQTTGPPPLYLTYKWDFFLTKGY